MKKVIEKLSNGVIEVDNTLYVEDRVNVWVVMIEEGLRSYSVYFYYKTTLSNYISAIIDMVEFYDIKIEQQSITKSKLYDIKVNNWKYNFFKLEESVDEFYKLRDRALKREILYEKLEKMGGKTSRVTVPFGLEEIHLNMITFELRQMKRILDKKNNSKI